MPNQVHGALLHAMSGTQLSRVRTELRPTVNIHSRSATSSTTARPTGDPRPPWRCSFPDASPDASIFAASLGYTGLQLAPLPPSKKRASPGSQRKLLQLGSLFRTPPAVFLALPFRSSPAPAADS